MSLFSFLFQRDAHLDQHEHAAALEAARRATASLDIDAAITAHERWKTRLLERLQGVQAQPVHPDQISDEHQCSLGHWIDADGHQQLARYATFRELQESHQRFHGLAAEILVLAELGRMDDAHHLLEGEFSKLSRSICQRLQDLKALA